MKGVCQEAAVAVTAAAVVGPGVEAEVQDGIRGMLTAICCVF